MSYYFPSAPIQVNQLLFLQGVNHARRHRTFKLVKALEYERQSREIDKMTLTEAREFAKSYLKLYFKQQEVIGSIANM